MLFKIDGISVFTVELIGVVLAFLGTFILTAALKNKLPRDQGRAFAVEGAKSAGKPRGAGIIFVLAFAVTALLTCEFSYELLFYILLVIAEMFTGFFDDAAEKPWNEYLKGALDFIISVLVAVVFLANNDPDLILYGFNGASLIVTLPTVVYGILIVILVWVAINVANCTDGVDGLSGSVAIVTLLSFFYVSKYTGIADHFNFATLVFALCLLAYLWFNATPSLLLMGDAGSRAMGIFIAIVSLKSGNPLLFIPFALVMILDGGLGLVKVFLLRFLKIHILKNTTTPLHDHVRKKKEWSNAQVTIRFTILQLIISLFVIVVLKEAFVFV